jgi:hypothetical protein
MTIHEDADRRNSPTTNEKILFELHATRAELTALRRLFDQFAGAFLNAKFQYGKPTDRWAPR